MLNYQPLETFLRQLSIIIIYAGIAQGFFVAILLNNKSLKRSRANTFLSVLLLAMSFSITHAVYASSVLDHFSVPAYRLGDPTVFLIAPLLWFYAKELTGERVHGARQVLHFAPFLLIILCSFLLKTLAADNPLIGLLNSRPGISAVFLWTSVIIQLSFYLYFVNKKWRGYEEQMEQEVSNRENVNISWVRFFIWVFLVINFFFFIMLATLIHKKDLVWISRAIPVILSLSIFALGYKGILQREIFYPEREKESGRISSSELPIESKKPNQELIDKILLYMDQRQPYLDPELTLSSMARDLGLNRSQLSQLINDGIGDNFYNFVNKYRVEQVKKFMCDPAMKNYNMLGMALEAGFKSKSTFNLIFKRFTGLTPTEYIKNKTR